MKHKKNDTTYQMSLDIYNEIKNRIDSSKKIKQYLTKLLRYDKFCHKYLSHGSSGKVFSFKSPTPISYKYEDGRILTFNDIAVKVSDENGPVNISIEGDKVRFVTVENPVGEAIVSIIISSLFFRGVTPHVICCLGYSVCEQSTEIYYEQLIVDVPHKEKRYVSDKDGFITNLMDLSVYFKAIGLTNNKEKLEAAIDSMLIALFHTMFILQHNFKLVHFDLFVRNMFMKVFDDTPYFMGHKMKSFKYFCYKFPGKVRLYTKNPGFILKIGDFGLSMMSVDDKVIFENNNETKQSTILFNKYYRDYPNVNKFIPDYIFVIRAFAHMFGLASSRLLRKLLLEVPAIADADDVSLDILNGYFDYDINRVQSIKEIVSRKDLFDHSIPSDATKENTLVIGYKLR